MKMLSISTEVFQALLSKNIDKDQIIMTIATYNPEVLLSALHMDDLTYHVQLAYQSSELGRNDKVAAIKKYRSLTGTNLREAKEAVELMIENKEIVGYV